MISSGSFKGNGREKKTNVKVQTEGKVTMRVLFFHCFFQLVKMLMVVVTVYTLCYFPLNIVWVSLYLSNVFELLIKLFLNFSQLILEASGFLTASSEAGYR